ncbi:MAG: polysaccharide deacetylase family protein [Anaerostipes hadrus]
MTFDCGYENGFTPKILDVLKRQKVVAAFFCNKTIYQRGSKARKAYEKRWAYRRKSHGTS